MIIKPAIRNNLYLNAHPIGCSEYVKELFDEAKKLPNFNGPKRVLIIGGSSGYGLSSRVTLAQNANASTINVSFESRPKDQRTGTAGYWNNIAFLKQAKKLDSKHYDILGNAFSPKIKEVAIDKIKETFGQVDLVIYSLAAGARLNFETNEMVYSAIKPIGEDMAGKTLDVATKKIKDINISAATEDEIKGTVFVMGGSDWKAWVDALDQAGVLSPHAKTVSYTYVGSGTMDKIYRSGTIGRAKDDLEATANTLNELLKHKYQGEAMVSSSKAVTTKASVFIPGITSYISCLFDVMKEQGTHESILAHKHRLFKDMIYGEKRITDSKNRVRIDHYEMDSVVQTKTNECVLAHQDESIFELPGTNKFISEFHHINGFGYDGVDYDADVDFETLAPKDLNLMDCMDL